MRPLIIVAAVFLLGALSTRALQLSDFAGGLGRNWNAIKLLEQGDAEFRGGNLPAARRDFDAAIRSDPTLWVAIFWRARLSTREGKWEAVVRDCNEVLRQESTFVQAAVLRAEANMELGRYALSLHDLDNAILLRPGKTETYADALFGRAWIRATCPDASFRNGRGALDDAKKLCNLLNWSQSDAIDTLAAAYAEVGDFDSAIRYEQQALSKPDAGLISRELQQHQALFKQHRPLRMK